MNTHSYAHLIFDKGAQMAPLQPMLLGKVGYLLSES
jgi:hypothetical protein